MKRTLYLFLVILIVIAFGACQKKRYACTNGDPNGSAYQSTIADTRTDTCTNVRTDTRPG